MSAPTTRRGFLSGLTTLPLWEGSVALVGSPTAVAAPPSRRLVGAYLEWLRLEQAVLIQDLGLWDAHGTIPVLPGAGAAQRWHRNSALIGPAAAPETRAALVLATVGLDPAAQGATGRAAP